jgi:hypothetical protein
MTITIQLPPDLEKQLLEKASAAGLAAEDFVMDVLAKRLAQQTPAVDRSSHLGQDESQLLAEINRGLPESTWKRYHHLVAKRKDESLSDEEHAELITLSDMVELANACRLKNVVELARLRGVEVKVLMDELGIRDPGYV